MRTEEECREMLKECKMKRDFWLERIIKIQGKELDYPHQLEDYEGSREAWAQRVKTLEYVLGINDII